MSLSDKILTFDSFHKSMITTEDVKDFIKAITADIIIHKDYPIELAIIKRINKRAGDKLIWNYIGILELEKHC